MSSFLIFLLPVCFQFPIFSNVSFLIFLVPLSSSFLLHSFLSFEGSDFLILLISVSYVPHFQFLRFLYFSDSVLSSRLAHVFRFSDFPYFITFQLFPKLTKSVSQLLSFSAIRFSFSNDLIFFQILSIFCFFVSHQFFVLPFFIPVFLKFL